MKKSVLMLFMIAIGFGAFAQVVSIKKAPVNSHLLKKGADVKETKIRNYQEANVASSKAIIYQEDFGSGFPADWTMNGGWKLSFNAPHGAIINHPNSTTHVDSIKSPTAGNGFMLLDGDSINTNWSNPSNPQLASNILDLDASIITKSYDFTGHPKVHLTFYHQFQIFYGYELTIYVSNDNGTTWGDTIDVGHDYLSYTRSSTMFERVNISKIAGNSNNVKIKFRFSGTSHYFWMIDDIQFEDAIDNYITWNDLTVYNGFSQVPAGHNAKVSVVAQFTNDGANDLTNVSLVAKELSTSTSAASTPWNTFYAHPDSSIADEVVDFFTYNTAGTRYFSFNLTSNEVPSIPFAPRYYPLTDTLTSVVGDSMYAYDDDYYDWRQYTWYGMAGGTSLNYEVGNYMQMGNDCSAHGVQFRLNENTSVGARVRVIIYKGLTILAQSSQYTIQAADIPNPDDPNGYGKPLVYVAFTGNPINLYKDSTYIVSVMAVGNDTVYFAQGCSIPQPTATWLFKEGGATLWTYFSNVTRYETPHIRLAVGAFVGIEELDENIATLHPISPNPVNGNAIISYELNKASKVTLTITDLTGRVLTSINNGTQEAGSHSYVLDASKYAAGTYFYTLNAGNFHKTLKMVVR